MVHGFAKQSGGHLDIYSELGHGTSVNLYLPVVGASADEVAIANDNGNTNIQVNQTVLVVEDDARVRRTTVARLEQLAYQVVQAESGPQALDILAKRNDIDVVFTDMIMPGGMTGAELLVQVQDLYPQIMQIITSGYAEDGTIPNDGTPCLRKPYSLAEMSKVFRQLSA
jgi:CheY-like chemotaxis protein